MLKEPKRTGASQNWPNIENDDKEEPSSIKWDDVLRWRELESEVILMLSAVKENGRKNLLEANKAVKLQFSESTDAGYFVALMTKGIFGSKTASIVFCKTDNKSMEEQLKCSKVIQDLRLRVDVARLREMVKLAKIEVQWLYKTHQLTNPLTKYGASAVCLIDILKCRKL